MAKIENSPSSRASLQYHSFDMSRDLVFSSPFGMILPTFFDYLMAGEKVTFSVDMFTRSEPLVKPALLRVYEQVDWFFVPMNQIYSLFGDLYDGIQDVKSSLVTPGSIRPYFPTLSYRKIFNAYFQVSSGGTHLQVKNDANALDIMGVPKINDARRLFQLFGFSSVALEPSQDIFDVSHIVLDTSLLSNYSFNVFPVCAYHKIYMDYYRLSNWEANDPSLYNLDKFYDSDSLGASSDYILNLFSCHYVPWKKDYFTNVFPSPVIGSMSVSSLPNGINQGQINNPTGLFSYLLVSNGTGSNLNSDSVSPNTVALNSQYLTPSGSFVNTASGIRGTFALEKLLEVTRRAGKHYDKQTLAHFGVKVDKGISGEVYYLGSDRNHIDFNEVISSANTVSETGDGSALGAIAGQGIGGSNGQKKEFTAPYHGILMAVCYVKSPSYYDSSIHLDKLSSISQSSDFYHPELDNLSMQPLFGYEWRFFPFGSTFAGATPDSWGNSLVSWQYQYSQYKTKYDIVAGKICYGDDSAWAPTRPFGFYSNPLQRLLCSPTYLDGLFEVKFSAPGDVLIDDAPGTWSKRDPFLHYYRFNVYKTSTMSTYSLPRLID